MHWVLEDGERVDSPEQAIWKGTPRTKPETVLCSLGCCNDGVNSSLCGRLLGCTMQYAIVYIGEEGIGVAIPSCTKIFTYTTHFDRNDQWKHLSRSDYKKVQTTQGHWQFLKKSKDEREWLSGLWNMKEGNVGLRPVSLNKIPQGNCATMFDALKADVWIVSESSWMLQFFQMKSNPPTVLQSVTVQPDFTWYVHISKKAVHRGATDWSSTFWRRWRVRVFWRVFWKSSILLSTSTKTSTYKTKNPYADRELDFTCDLPLVKTSRICIANSYTHSKSWRLQVR